MRKYLLLLPFLLILSIVTFQPLKAQTLELLGGNTLNGAVNGVILGGATMALQNNSHNFEPVRVGLGAGVLYGLGVGVHDISQVEAGQQFYISGTFNGGTNSSILVLLDTFYGAAAGALVASSISLIIKAPFVDAIQYGTGAGAWLGFGYGLVDAFMFAKGPSFGQQRALATSSEVSGLVTYSNAAKSIEIGMLSPALIQQKEVTRAALKTTYHPSLNVIQLNIDL